MRAIFKTNVSSFFCFSGINPIGCLVNKSMVIHNCVGITYQYQILVYHFQAFRNKKTKCVFWQIIVDA